jgi:hypothetical protein
LTGQGHSTTGGFGSNTAGGALGHDNRTGGLDHRQGEDSDLPRALTEDVSKAQPHSAHHDDHHSAGTASHTKPSMKDKLNPKVDADGDGKAGFMK